MNARLLILALCAFAAAASSGCGRCEDGGRTYAPGASWKCSDGCNTCSCDRDAPFALFRRGAITTTAIGCPKPKALSSQKHACSVKGVTYAHGSSLSCDNGCGVCSCNDGQLASEPCQSGAEDGGALD